MSSTTIGSVGANVHLSAPTVSADATLPSNRLKIDLNRIQNSSDDGTVSADNVIEWNGKRYSLTDIQDDGAEKYYVGHSKDDWNKIAQEMIGLWNDMKAKNPQFSFQYGNLNTDNKTWRQRSSNERSVETIDFTNPAANSFSVPYINLLPSVSKVENLFTTNRVASHRMQSNPNIPPPKARPLEEHNPQRHPPIPDPVNPPPEPVVELPWYKRWASKVKDGAVSLKDKIASFFSRTPAPVPPTPAPAPAPVPTPISTI